MTDPYIEHVRRHKVPASGGIPSRLLIVGEAPGADEERLGKPFVGKSGWLLDQMLTEAGGGRGECFVTNVCKYRPLKNELEGKNHAWWTASKAKAQKHGCTHFSDGMFYNDLLAEGLVELRREIAAVRPQCIIGLGNAALWALTGELGISNWRGSEMWLKQPPEAGESIPVIPTYHPAYVLRMWQWKAAVVHDIRRRALGKMADPASREMPPFRFLIPTTASEAITFLDKLLLWLTSYDLTCDVETRHGRIACVGFGWSPLDALCIPMMHVNGERMWESDIERIIAGHIRRIMEHPEIRLINQNFNYDRQYFVRDPAFGFRPRLHYDTMIGQHLLFPGAPKDLAYQSSLYCQWYRFWKDEGKEITSADEAKWWNYNCMDAVATWEIASVTRPLLVKTGFATEAL